VSRVVTAPLVSTNDEEVQVGEWLKEPYAFVRTGDAIGLVEGMKAALEIYSEEMGYFVPIKAPGSTVRVGECIAVILTERNENVDEILARFQASQGQQIDEVQAAESQRWTKKAELLAKRHGVRIEDIGVQGTIREEDVRGFLDQRERTAPRFAARDLVDDVYSDNRCKRVLILGGGNACVQVLSTMHRIKELRPVGILDDNADIWGKSIMGCPILGPISQLNELWNAQAFDAAVVSFAGDLESRADLFESSQASGIPFCNVIDPTALVHSNVSMGTGNIIMAYCQIGACTAVGSNNLLSAYVDIEHHNALGSSCTFGPGVFASGRVSIGDRVKFGTGVFIEPGVRIGSRSIVASGVVLTKDLPASSIAKQRSNYTIQPRAN